jgi:MYXO-CTERM domain-containing protein
MIGSIMRAPSPRPNAAPTSRAARRLLGRATSLAAFAVIALGARAAAAYDVLAVPCQEGGVASWTCESGHVAYDKTEKLPIEWNFDTGWVPQGSPLQVHLAAGIFAHTRVALAGDLQNDWPKAFVLTAPGDPRGGAIGFRYGAQVIAQGKVDISVAGQHFTWQGDLPYIPNFDFEAWGQQGFAAWAYAPGVSITGETPQQKLVSIGLSDILGGSIPGVDGGFELDVAMALKTTYVNERIVVTQAVDGQPVKGGPITSEDGETTCVYKGGPYVELDVHPEGTVDYDGILHLIPAFYISVLGKDWSIPIADIPIAFPITKVDWVFAPQRVHYPLPDLTLSRREIDFGTVEVGQKRLAPLPLVNKGEAALAVVMTTDAPEVFPPYDPEVEIAAKGSKDSAVRFVPSHAGEFHGVLLVASNDPDEPLQQVKLRGVGVDPAPPTMHAALEDAPPAAAADAPEAGDTGGCGCHLATSDEGGAGAAGWMALAVVAAFARRRRARR